MTKDAIVEQVREVREARAAKLNFDLRAILADARRRQPASGRCVVSFIAKSRKAG